MRTLRFRIRARLRNTQRPFVPLQTTSPATKPFRCSAPDARSTPRHRYGFRKTRDVSDPASGSCRARAMFSISAPVPPYDFVYPALPSFDPSASPSHPPALLLTSTFTGISPLLPGLTLFLSFRQLNNSPLIPVYGIAPLTPKLLLARGF